MRRREFIAGPGSAAVWPVVARAQQPTKRLPTVGYLGGGSPANQRAWVDAVVERLQVAGSQALWRGVSRTPVPP
jgi:hypothetical protein